MTHFESDSFKKCPMVKVTLFASNLFSKVNTPSPVAKYTLRNHFSAICKNLFSFERKSRIIVKSAKTSLSMVSLKTLVKKKSENNLPKKCFWWTKNTQNSPLIWFLIGCNSKTTPPIGKILPPIDFFRVKWPYCNVFESYFQFYIY